jgi:hypothetical protein
VDDDDNSSDDEISSTHNKLLLRMSRVNILPLGESTTTLSSKKPIIRYAPTTTEKTESMNTKVLLWCTVVV